MSSTTTTEPKTRKTKRKPEPSPYDRASAKAEAEAPKLADSRAGEITDLLGRRIESGHREQQREADARYRLLLDSITQDIRSGEPEATRRYQRVAWSIIEETLANAGKSLDDLRLDLSVEFLPLVENELTTRHYNAILQTDNAERAAEVERRRADGQEYDAETGKWYKPEYVD